MNRGRISVLKDFRHEKTYTSTSLKYRLVRNGFLKGIGVDYVRVEKNKILKPHFHKKPKVLIVVIDGSGFIYLDGRERHIRKGSIIEISPKMWHGFRTKNKPLIFLSIQTPPIYGQDAVKDTYYG